MPSKESRGHGGRREGDSDLDKCHDYSITAGEFADQTRVDAKRAEKAAEESEGFKAGAAHHANRANRASVFTVSLLGITVVSVMLLLSQWPAVPYPHSTGGNLTPKLYNIDQPQPIILHRKAPRVLGVYCYPWFATGNACSSGGCEFGRYCTSEDCTPPGCPFDNYETTCRGSSSTPCPQNLDPNDNDTNAWFTAEGYTWDSNAGDWKETATGEYLQDQLDAQCGAGC